MARKLKRLPRGKVSVFLLSVLIAVTLLIAGYFWMVEKTRAVPAESLEHVIIATNTAYVGVCPVIAAREKGYFTSEGVFAIIQPYSSGKAAMEAVLQGRANLGTVADIPVMFAATNNRPISVIATIFKTGKDHGVVGRRDRGVDSIASLKGKKIGVTLDTSGHFALDSLLNRSQLSPDEVTMRNYKPDELANALVQGEVDAVATWEPFLDSSLVELGSNGVVFYGQDIFAILYNVSGMREYVMDHPETIKKVLRALIRGAKFCSESPDEASGLFTAVLKAATTKLRASWQAYQFNVELNQGLILALEDETRWAIKNKRVGAVQMPNYLNYIYLDGLEEVMPSAVTIIH